MKRSEFSSVIDRLTSVDQIVFYVGGEKVSDRFDKEEKETSLDTYEDKISYALYSWIINAVFDKAKGKEACRKGEVHFSAFLSSLKKKTASDIAQDTDIEIQKALNVLSSFYYDKEKVSMADLLSSFAPLVLLSLSQQNPDDEKKIFKAFTKNKETIFNQTILFTRSLFHSFLTLSNINPNDIHSDTNNLNNGLFTYQNQLFIPSYENAYTLAGFKSIVNKALDQVSDNFSLADVNQFTVLYLAKDLIAAYPFSK